MSHEAEMQSPCCESTYGLTWCYADVPAPVGAPFSSVSVLACLSFASKQEWFQYQAADKHCVWRSLTLVIFSA